MNAEFPLENLERAKGFEPSTLTLARLCSTPELHPLDTAKGRSGCYMAEEGRDCNRESWAGAGSGGRRIFERTMAVFIFETGCESGGLPRRRLRV